jgi:hypothetical protein
VREAQSLCRSVPLKASSSKQATGLQLQTGSPGSRFHFLYRLSKILFFLIC